MRRRAELSLADVLEAFARLRPGDASSRALLIRMLDPQGLLESWTREEAPVRNAPPPLTGSSSPASQRPGNEPPDLVTEEPRQAPVANGQERVVTVRPSPSRRTFERWSFPSSEMLEPPGASLPPLSPPSPLFVPEWHAGLLAAALAVPQPEGPLDLARTVELLARQTPVTSFPRRPVRSLRSGVRVLLDVSESMMPFARDRAQLLARVRAVVGPDRVEVQRFEGSPSRGVRRLARSAPEPFVPPATGTPVLVLSDVGLGGELLSAQHADVAEWLDFAKGVRRAGNRLVALVPYGPKRWPSALGRHMVLIHWDRGTTARSVLQALRG